MAMRTIARHALIITSAVAVVAIAFYIALVMAQPANAGVCPQNPTIDANGAPHDDEGKFCSLGATTTSSTPATTTAPLRATPRFTG